MNPSDDMASIRYWIYERDETPQQFPLKRLVLKVRDSLGDTNPRLRVTKARGYGERVQAWDTLLDDNDEVPVDFASLSGMTEGREEWFYDLQVECAAREGRIVFGLHDSTALFVEAPKGVADVVVAEFKDVRTVGAG